MVRKIIKQVISTKLNPYQLRNYRMDLLFQCLILNDYKRK